MRIETLLVLADTRSTINHYRMESANILDRVLRVTGTAATPGPMEGYGAGLAAVQKIYRLEM